MSRPDPLSLSTIATVTPGPPETAQSQAAPERCEFPSGGQRCRGWIYRPPGAEPVPCVLLAHGFGAAPDGPLGRLARQLQAAGIAALTFDFRHFGDSDGHPRQLLKIEHHLEDWRAALSFARREPAFDKSRLGLWGSSLTGGEVLAIAAEDHTIAAVVAQVPYCDGVRMAWAAGFRHHLRAIPGLARDLTRAALGRRPFLIEGVGPPGDSAMITTRTPEVHRALVADTPRWRNEIAARSVLSLYRFRPILKASHIQSPMLVVLVYADHVAPPEAALQIAESLPYVELAMFPAHHFQLYAGEVFRRAATTEVGFFRHKLGLADRELSVRSGRDAFST